MAQITQWLSEQSQAQAAKFIVDDTVENLKRREGLLDMVAPIETYDDRDFLGYVLEEINTVASIIGVGTEPPNTQHGTFRKITAELIKTGLQRVYDEQYMWDMQKAMEEAKYKNVRVQNMRDPKTGRVIKGVNNSLAQYIFGTIKGLAASHTDLLNKLTWDVFQTGELNHNDPRTRLNVSISYKTPGALYNHFPAALTGGDMWDQYATADGISNLYDDVDTYTDTNGFPPKLIAMSRKTLNHLQKQESTKAAVNQLRGAATIGSVSRAMLGEALQAQDLPGIITFDEMYKYEAEDKTTTNVRFLNEGRYVFLQEDMATRALGPVLESGGAVGGITVVTREIKKFPPVDASQSVATMLPVIPNPKLLYSRQVHI